MAAFVLAIISMSAPPVSAQAPPSVANGVIDLRGWDFVHGGPVPLNGQWLFYWDRFIDPNEHPDRKTAASPERIRVPDVWNGFSHEGRPIGGYGHATYRVRIRLDGDLPEMGLHITDAATACRIYANGKPIYSAGRPGITADRSRPSFKPAVVHLPVADTIDLVVHISNFHHRQGGLWDRVSVGTVNQLLELREQRIVFNMILFGGLLLMGLYHLGLYGLRRADPSPLYFALGCLAILLRTVTTGERYIVQLFDGFPFELLSKMEYWGFYLAIGFFALFVQSVFPKESDRRAVQIVVILSLAFSGLVLVTPLSVYSYTTPVFEAITLAALTYGLVIMIQALTRKRMGAGILLGGFLVMAATAVNDILYSRQFIQSFYMVQLGVLVFTLSQALLMSRRSSALFAMVEAQQQELLASEEKYRLLVNNADDAIFIIQDGTFQFANPRTAGLFGYRESTLNGMPFVSCVHPEDRNTLKASITEGMPGAGVRTETFRVLNADGKTRWVQLNAVPTSWHGRPAVLCFLRDINERKQLETRLHRAQKMEALSTLAGGMARDISRFVEDVMRHTEAVMGQLASGSEYRPLLQKIIDASSGARRLLDQFFIFSRSRGALDLQPMQIAAGLEDTLRILESAMPPNIQMVTDVAARHATVMANDVQVRHVLINLVNNAVDAVGDQPGTIRISLHEVAVGPGVGSQNRALTTGAYARLTVTDTGGGIPEELMDRIFDPYFTTKSETEGTGMGLSAVMGIVSNHKGDVEVISTPGMGTTVHVYLPMAHSAERKSA